MGASIKIQDTNLDITQFKCSQCQQQFTPQDKENNNWDLWFDTSNDVIIEEIWNKGFTMSIWVKDIAHKFWASENGLKGYYDCPDTERCQGCYEKFLTPQLKEKEGYWWCKSCQPSAGFTEKEEVKNA